MTYKLYSTPAPLTTEQEAFIAKQYASCLDSVAFMASTKPEQVTDEDWLDQTERNRAHLVIMLEKPYWTNEDLDPIKIALGLIKPVPAIVAEPTVAKAQVVLTPAVEAEPRKLNIFEQCLKHIISR